jgi:hypothetical protein
MRTITPDDIKGWARRAAVAITGIVIVGSVALVWLWRDRPDLEAIDWPPYPTIAPTLDAVTVTWFGVSTLLFDDGEQQILVDGFFSRPSLADSVLGRPVASDASRINYVLDEYRMGRLAAIITAHSHYEHAMDIGAIANRSSASILGSETSAQIARGAGVPEDQIIVAEDGAKYEFGRFTVTMLESTHAPIGWGGSVPFAGTLDEPLETPAPISAWREGKSYTIVVAHPHGTTIVHAWRGPARGSWPGLHGRILAYAGHDDWRHPRNTGPFR